jgi:hypothetical protein
MLGGVDVPNDRVVMHSCDNPPCVNPAHLRVGTQLENMRDAKSKGRLWPRSCKFGHALHGTNLYVRPSDGAKICRTCQRDSQRRYIARRASKAS